MANPGITLSGAEDVLRYFQSIRAAFAESGIDPDFQALDWESTVALELTLWGRNQTGALGRIAPEGRDLRLPMCAVFRVEHGKIREIRLFYNVGSIAAQLQKDDR